MITKVNLSMTVGDDVSVKGITNYTNSGSYWHQTLQNVGTAWEQLSLGDLGNCKYLYIENTETLNTSSFVSASLTLATGSNGAGAFATIKPESFILLSPISGSTSNILYIKTVSGSVKAKIAGCEY